MQFGRFYIVSFLLTFLVEHIMLLLPNLKRGLFVFCHALLGKHYLGVHF